MTEQPEQTASKPPAPDPTVVRDAVARQAVLGALLAEVKDAYGEAKKAADNLLDKAYKAGATPTVDALLPDGTKIGSSSRKPGERAAQVVDDEAFRVWVRDNFPSEHVVEFVPAQVITTVRPGFLGRVLNEVNAAGTAEFVDEASGVMHKVPGVEIRPSKAASYRLTYTRGSKAQPLSGHALVAAAWRAGALAEHLPALAPVQPTPAPATEPTP
ncbi:hypothetical protein MHW47_10745 [Streptomyces sp. OfavH-34-F]|uniref:hypothetical protein n=1 Tax=Streptomyces sp. OfavH-34-F TaxID=2917760 RepID=UPI001EF33F4C|nr:hypothetical protein [Streptomyces sp. OfavH-34-F]MCG7524911.1 hypothetical protein [Streptomyces sp. OfavH-34-F]